jgi:flavin-dependent dehydrogenase
MSLARVNLITKHKQYDVVIMGGGLAGLTLARQLLQRQPELNLLVIEKNSHPVPEAAHKVGEATAEMSSYYLSEVLGLREHLRCTQLRKMALRFFPSASSPPPPLSERMEVGPSVFHPGETYTLDRGRFENNLGAMLTEQGGEFCDGCRVESFALEGTGHTVTVRRNDETGVVTARWLIDASGRRGIIKHRLKLQEDVGHACSAAWLRLSEMIWMDGLIDYQDPKPSRAAAEQWAERVPNGQRWRSTNHLMGRGYWVWLIPLASGSISIGLVADPAYVPFEQIDSQERLVDWIRRHEPELGRALNDNRGEIQDFHMLRHYAYGCKQVFSADRWALTGEAGTFNDPLYSPGSNFIAIANTMITELIVRDLAGEDITGLTPQYDAFYLWIFKSLMPLWEDQYGLMGNPQVWSVKSTWDLLSYLMLPAVLYYNECMTDLAFMESIAPEVAQFTTLNMRMQAFFKEWNLLTSGTNEARFVDTGVGFIREHVAASTEPLDREQVTAKVRTNLALAEDVARVIMGWAAGHLGMPVDAAAINPLDFTLGAGSGGRERVDARKGNGLNGSSERRISKTRTALAGLWA